MNLTHFFKPTMFNAAGNVILWIDARQSMDIAPRYLIEQFYSNPEIGPYPSNPDIFAVLTLLDRGHMFASFFNPDGTHEQICGNAMRCIPQLLGVNQDWVKVRTCAGTVNTIAHDRFHGAAVFPRHMLGKVSWRTDSSLFVDPGTPHVVTFVDDLSTSYVETLGNTLSHGSLPVNATFVVRQPTSFLVRTFERGVSETRSCGTGAMSAVLAWEAMAESEMSEERTIEVAFFSGERLFVHSSANTLRLDGICIPLFHMPMV